MKILQIPNNHIRITSPYGMRVHPTTKKETFHYGVDLGDDNVGQENGYAIADGVVTNYYITKTAGGVLEIKHTNVLGIGTVYSRYLHCSPYVKKGDTVKKGQKVSKEGTTKAAMGTYTTGSHLHFELRLGTVKGKTVDPMLRMFVGEDQTVDGNANTKKYRTSLMWAKQSQRVDNSKDQVTVEIYGLNCRNKSSVKGTDVGNVGIGDVFDVLDKKSAEGYTWYKVYRERTKDTVWIADKNGAYLTFAPKKVELPVISQPDPEEVPDTPVILPEAPQNDELCSFEYKDKYTADKNRTVSVKMLKGQTIGIKKKRD